MSINVYRRAPVSSLYELEAEVTRRTAEIAAAAADARLVRGAAAGRRSGWSLPGLLARMTARTRAALATGAPAAACCPSTAACCPAAA
jgi:hypothetical protein